MHQVDLLNMGRVPLLSISLAVIAAREKTPRRRTLNDNNPVVNVRFLFNTDVSSCEGTIESHQ